MFGAHWELGDDMKLGALTLIAVTLVTTSGCARNNLLANRISAESYENFREGDTVAEGNERSYARVFAWDSDFSAGMGNEKGMCAQGALTARSANYGAALKAAIEKADADFETRMQFIEEVQRLNATSTQTAYANIGYFFVCQMMLNNMSAPEEQRFSSDDIYKMFKHVGDTASTLTQPASNPSSVGVSELKALRAYIDNAVKAAENAEDARSEGPITTPSDDGSTADSTDESAERLE